jgi:hypothetical protein
METTPRDIRRGVPEGARRLEAWLQKGELIVLGDPWDAEPPQVDGDCDHPDAHHCDAMGCGSMSHVLFRGNLLSLTKGRKTETTPIDIIRTLLEAVLATTDMDAAGERLGAAVNAAADFLADTADAAGMPGNWYVCPSTHCERSKECRSPHECSGRGRHAAKSGGPRCVLPPTLRCPQPPGAPTEVTHCDTCHADLLPDADPVEWTDAEQAALTALASEKDLSEHAVLRQALRLYQLVSNDPSIVHMPDNFLPPHLRPAAPPVQATATGATLARDLRKLLDRADQFAHEMKADGVKFDLADAISADPRFSGWLAGHGHEIAALLDPPPDDAPTERSLNTCHACGVRLAPDDFDGICSACDHDEEPTAEVPRAG